MAAILASPCCTHPCGRDSKPARQRHTAHLQQPRQQQPGAALESEGAAPAVGGGLEVHFDNWHAPRRDVRRVAACGTSCVLFGGAVCALCDGLRGTVARKGKHPLSPAPGCQPAAAPAVHSLLALPPVLTRLLGRRLQRFQR